MIPNTPRQLITKLGAMYIHAYAANKFIEWTASGTVGSGNDLETQQEKKFIHPFNEKAIRHSKSLGIVQK